MTQSTDMTDGSQMVDHAQVPHKQAQLPGWLIILLAAACGLIAANLYYAQTLVGPIAADLGLHEQAAGTIVTMAQIGYVMGLLFIVPLADLLENRRLIIGISCLGVASLIAAGTINQPSVFLLASLGIGLGSVAVQVIVPYAAHLACDENRGQVIGKLLSGLFLGIMLSRPVASFVAEFFSWHAVFLLSAVIMLLLLMTLLLVLPARQPSAREGYLPILRSMLNLLLTYPVLRRRAFYQAAMFGTFSLFWTAVPLLLASPLYGFSHSDIAIFALIGVAGAIAAPVAGRFADKGYTRLMTGVAIVLVGISMLISLVGPAGSHLSVAALLIAATLIDLGAAANLVTSQQMIFADYPQFRSRINGVFMAIFFIGGATGSALGGWAYAHGGWSEVVLTGMVLPVLAGVYFLTEFSRKVKQA